MPDGYDSHADYMGWVQEDSKARSVSLRQTLLEAFARFIEVRQVQLINFSAMTVMDLAAAVKSQPSILKPLMAFRRGPHSPSSVDR